tara:strand:- start:1214 stop:1396 length:183 start_codon:yes stop_codon:yes gene_type:complete
MIPYQIEGTALSVKANSTPANALWALAVSKEERPLGRLANCWLRVICRQDEWVVRLIKES